MVRFVYAFFLLSILPVAVDASEVSSTESLAMLEDYMKISPASDNSFNSSTEKWGSDINERFLSTAFLWTQIGEEVDAKQGGETFGKDIALSANGNIMAVSGSTYTKDQGTAQAVSSVGVVRIYQRIVGGSDDDEWEQLGDDIIGDVFNLLLGLSIDLSDSGHTIAIGAPDLNGSTTGSVRVYDWDGTMWNRRVDIPGLEVGERFGWSVAISAGGNTVAAGAPFFGTDSRGIVRVYDWIADTGGGTDSWDLRGTPIEGEAISQNFGNFVDLSADGNTFLLGSGTASSSSVRIYDWNEDGSGSWEIRRIEQNLGSNLNFVPSLSGDGTTFAVGLPSFVTLSGSPPATPIVVKVGFVDIYKWNVVDDRWDQKGSTISPNGADGLGSSVYLSNDGNTLGIGATIVSGSRGALRVYEWTPVGDGGSWEKRGEDIVGTDSNELFGSSIALTQDGYIVAGGAPSHDARGTARAYSWPEPSESPSFSRFPSTQPSFSGAPSSMPSISSHPSQEPSLSNSPSSEPSLSTMPSATPSVSFHPSQSPSDVPSLSNQPSSEPSQRPSISLDPSSTPSLSNQPSAAPSLSSQPSSTPPATDCFKSAKTKSPSFVKTKSPSTERKTRPPSSRKVSRNKSPIICQSSAPGSMAKSPKS